MRLAGFRLDAQSLRRPLESLGLVALGCPASDVHVVPLGHVQRFDR